MIQKTFFIKELEKIFDPFPKYKQTRILLGGFNAKLGREDIF
jgi:hypothetical protein